MRLSIRDLIVLRRVHVLGPQGTAQADLLLDTGAAITTLSTSVVEAAGFDLSTIVQTQRIVTGNGVVEAPFLLIPELRVMELSVTDLLVCVLDIPEVAHIEGLLGVNFLKRFRTVIDFPQGFLEIS